MSRRPVARCAVTIVVGVVALLSISCGGSGAGRGDGDAGASGDASTTEVAPSSTAISPTTSGVVDARPLAVAAPVTIELVDTSRPTVRDGVRLSSMRSLPTTVWRPSAPGTYPLVVFAHGYRLGPIGYARFCRSLASLGYVVAAPSFPLADETRGNGLSRADIPEEATDVAFVNDAIRSSAIRSAIAAGPYGAVGHSDGADVVLLVGYGAGRTDPDVGAIVAMSPDAMTGSIVRSAVPMLLTHGTADSTVPYSEARTVDVQVLAPHWFLTLEGAEHLPPVADDTPWTPQLDRAVTLFLDATIGAFRGEVDALTSALDALALSHVTATK